MVTKQQFLDMLGAANLIPGPTSTEMAIHVGFARAGLVQQNAWLTQPQLLDAVAIGQFTPGPMLSTATFIGYILGGVPGAPAATVAIFCHGFSTRLCWLRYCSGCESLRGWGHFLIP